MGVLVGVVVGGAVHAAPPLAVLPTLRYGPPAALGAQGGPLLCLNVHHAVPCLDDT
jgi:hypothetical protein